MSKRLRFSTLLEPSLLFYLQWTTKILGTLKNSLLRIELSCHKNTTFNHSAFRRNHSSHSLHSVGTTLEHCSTAESFCTRKSNIVKNRRGTETKIEVVYRCPTAFVYSIKGITASSGGWQTWPSSPSSANGSPSPGTQLQRPLTEQTRQPILQ